LQVLLLEKEKNEKQKQKDAEEREAKKKKGEEVADARNTFQMSVPIYQLTVFRTTFEWISETKKKIAEMRK